jgi:TolB protein
MARLVPILAVLIFLGVTGSAQAASGKLAYAEETFDAPSVPQLRTVDPLGTAPPAAFGAPGACCGVAPAPSWSPDGTRIAFARPTFGTDGSSGLSDLWTVSADLTGPVDLTNTPDVGEREPAFAPAGDRLAFVADGAIQVLDLATGATVQLSPDAALDDEPDWSPDGKRIAFTRDGDVYVMDAMPGAAATRLTSRTTFDASPAWSPDGRRIVWAAGGSRPGIWRMRADGTHQTRLTRALDFHPAWSPDGRRIAFSRPIPDDTLLFPDYLWTMDRAGGHERRVRVGGEPVLGVTPDWG